MELSPEIYEQIAGCTEMHGDKKGPERRKSRRIPLTGRTTVMPLRGESLAPALTVRLRDISQTGVGLLQRDNVGVGSIFFIELPRRGERPIWARVVVTRVQPVNSTLFLVGGRFDCLLDGHPRDIVVPASGSPKAARRLTSEEMAARLKSDPLSEAREIERIRQSILS